MSEVSRQIRDSEENKPMLPSPAAMFGTRHGDPGAKSNLTLEELDGLCLANTILATGAVVWRNLCTKLVNGRLAK